MSKESDHQTVVEDGTQWQENCVDSKEVMQMWDVCGKKTKGGGNTGMAIKSGVLLKILHDKREEDCRWRVVIVLGKTLT